jgi:hypothetical protein
MTVEKLTEKQRRFVEAYMGEAAGNATEAARLAGYKGNAHTLANVGAENLRKPEITAAVERRVKADPKIATREQRQEFWTRVMNGDPEVGFAEMRDRLKASELLGKSQADFVEKVEHTGKNGGPIQTSGIDLRKLSDRELESLEEIIGKAGG